MNTKLLATLSFFFAGTLPCWAEHCLEEEIRIPQENASPSPQDWDQLIECVDRNHLEGVRQLLGKGINPNTPPVGKGRRPALFYVSFCSKDKDEMLETLLKNGADINSVDSDGNTRLMKASSAEEAQWLLRHGAKASLCNKRGEFALMAARDREMAEVLLDAAPQMLHREDSEGNTPLLAAAKFLSESQENTVSMFCVYSPAKSQEVLDFLLERGANPNAANKKGMTALMYAAQGGNAHAVRELLASEADATGRDATGRSALTYAMENGHGKIAAMLEQHGAPGGYHCAFIKAAAAGNTQALRHLLRRGVVRLEACGFAAMENAVTQGHAETAQMLADAGVDPNARNRQRKTLLFRAAQRKDTRAAAILLGIGADVNYPSGEPYSADRLALSEAARQGDLPMVRLLLSKGSRLDGALYEKRGREALSYAVDGGSEEVMDALLKAGADPNVLFAEGHGRTQVKLLGQPKLVRILLEAGADPNTRCRLSGVSPLDQAMRHHCHDVAMLLLEYGADPDETDNFNRNRLSSAACGAPAEFVAELLKRGARVNLIDTVPDRHQTPLIKAVLCRKQDSPEIIRLLLDAGADPSIRDAKGKSALDYAREKGFYASAALLQEAQP